ncbi:MAG: Holliday junction resolvase RuvX [Gammaproteobacteria bacterium]|nr:Holliday junction resolvase RuvX [Gammaproteobacteria bacterium]
MAFQRALVFDFGTRKIGIAAANRLAGTVTPLRTLPAQAGRPEWHQVAAIVAEWQPEVLVVGLPRNTDGTDSNMTAAARDFAAELARRTHLPTAEIDERYTSMEAEDVLRQQRRSGARTRRVRPGDIDLMAARLMAETWLRS